jgi:hypothetical protein
MIRDCSAKAAYTRTVPSPDPRNGSVYRVVMEVSPDGQKLKVRGYLGFELFGMTQVWRRLPSDALPRTQYPANLLRYLGQESNTPAN